MLFALALAAASPSLDASAAPLLTSVIAAGAAVDSRVDVLSSEDVRRAVDVEATQRLMGCDQKSQSCLAELAAAMGAGLVIVGQGGKLGDSLVFSVDLFDGEHATSGGRSLIKETSVDALATKTQDETHRLVANYLGAHPRAEGGPPLKVLVLDAKLTPTDAPAAPSAGFPWLAVAGGGVAVVGVVGLVVGGLLDASATSTKNAALLLPSTELARATADDQSADTTGGFAVAAYVGGVAALITGGIMAYVDLKGAE